MEKIVCGEAELLEYFNKSTRCIADSLCEYAIENDYLELFKFSVDRGAYGWLASYDLLARIKHHMSPTAFPSTTGEADDMIK